jgi:hypothetical protein
LPAQIVELDRKLSANLTLRAVAAVERCWLDEPKAGGYASSTFAGSRWSRKPRCAAASFVANALAIQGYARIAGGRQAAL